MKAPNNPKLLTNPTNSGSLSGWDSRLSVAESNALIERLLTLDEVEFEVLVAAVRLVRRTASRS